MKQLPGAESGLAAESKVEMWGQSLVYTVEELECKICYNRYDSRSRRPKLLACLHRVCLKCLKKMVDMGESSPSVVSCPFCRHETFIPDEEVWLMEDDRHVLAFLSCHDQLGRTGLPSGTEVVLSPDSLTGVEGAERGGAVGEATSDCLVLTIMQLPGESSESLSMINMLYPNSLPCNVSTHKCHAWTSRSFPRCLLGALCLVYFSSLPLGIYLLMIGQLWLGVVLVSLVPFTLLLCILYGFCQCLCHELLETLGHQNTVP
ncbi:E3 ubiquitin-protein ligase RNF182 [Merluccius polli]|uniref:E3 ubiquitin-protein ligase RNF182 n=1 Tax=Merluccius polli TaxID=89951 RepID=A0AA47LZT3_MERPO|nr:E3 ubiquitin-protein ligase RNF182 [Merluccius polli]